MSSVDGSFAKASLNGEIEILIATKLRLGKKSRDKAIIVERSLMTFRLNRKVSNIPLIIYI